MNLQMNHTYRRRILFGALLLPAVGLITSGWKNTIKRCITQLPMPASGYKFFDHAIQHLARISYSVYLVHIPLRTFMLRQWTADTAISGFVQGKSFFWTYFIWGSQ